jgi:hypothetical protein
MFVIGMDYRPVLIAGAAQPGAEKAGNQKDGK